MAKPRKETSQLFYDQFMSWPLDDQRIALRVLEQLYEQGQKFARADGGKTDSVASAAQIKLNGDPG